MQGLLQCRSRWYRLYLSVPPAVASIVAVEWHTFHSSLAPFGIWGSFPCLVAHNIGSRSGQMAYPSLGAGTVGLVVETPVVVGDTDAEELYLVGFHMIVVPDPVALERLGSVEAVPGVHLKLPVGMTSIGGKAVGAPLRS